MACHYYRPCGHPWRVLCDCEQVSQIAADLDGLDLSPEALYAADWSAIEALQGSL